MRPKNANRNRLIVKAVREGLSYTEAGERFGVSRQVIAGVCWRAGLRVGPRHIPALGQSQPEKAAAMRAAGASYDEIAEHFGWVRQTAKSQSYRGRQHDAYRAACAARYKRKTAPRATAGAVATQTNREG